MKDLTKYISACTLFSNGPIFLINIVIWFDVSEMLCECAASQDDMYEGYTTPQSCGMMRNTAPKTLISQVKMELMKPVKLKGHTYIWTAP